ncbi:hypothetical protein PHLGIDRAFT_28547 [Phlebiopsis gigantea 11061_1 CR5-6]|uniref:Mitochondrial escape protein 2 n=1 Tax=Phlebiopsis gigantea (strain 11061_1 CR5-6) TaxID=745531 RepID=A0A0C3NY39_PHLG1|nr:hypothetical protein PHLGIDRAFT_28547 [Phlebiopsis gigantea 11061_1 CR5-6]
MSQLTNLARQLRPSGVGRRLLLRQGQLSRVLGAARTFTEAADPSEASHEQDIEQDIVRPREAWLFVDSIFPVRRGTFEFVVHCLFWTVYKHETFFSFRNTIGLAREETLLSRLATLLTAVKTHSFQVKSLEPRHKDGGVFVNFAYDPGASEDEALKTIVHELRASVVSHGGVPSWMGVPTGSVWLVKGKPWREDMNHYASPIVRISFEGPDVKDETLYNLLRPYGRILDIIPPTPAPAGTLRSATIIFRNARAAAIAHNTIHGLSIPPDASSATFTRLRTRYQQPIQAHAIRDYISGHPKIFLPVFIFLLGSLTYTIFDPVRVFMVEGKINDFFDIKEYRLYKWMRSNFFDRFSMSTETEQNLNLITVSAWKEREEAAGALERYLSDAPSTVTFVHGPQGSGKSRMISAMLKETKRKALIIDIDALASAGSDAALVSALAAQTGYWPVFTFLNSTNNLIDLASVGLIGQKAGLSTSLTDQLKDILEVVGTGLRGVNTSHRKQHQREVKEQHKAQLRIEEEAKVREKIREGIWHDPRLDCIAGNGVMSELGIGDELFSELDADVKPPVVATLAVNNGANEKPRRAEDSEAEDKKQASSDDLQAFEAMPIVILKGFDSRGSGSKREEILTVVSQWAAGLVTGRIAHVVVTSDNRENAKLLAKALPSKPLNQIVLSDADSASALSFVKQKLHDVEVEVDFTSQQTKYIERLGGRASDLESLVHKVRSGMTVEQAVDDIITRDVGELRKSAFGDDADDAKNLPWLREQAWAIMKQLSKHAEIPYHEVLMEFPFKGDEGPLREMEHAELIAINTQNGRPSSIKPGKPVYRYVFEKLVHDPIFQASQEITYNQKIIASNEVIVKACEEELMTLKEVEAGTSHWWGSRRAVSTRGEYLLRKMRAAVEKIEALEKQNAALKKTLAKIH